MCSKSVKTSLEINCPHYPQAVHSIIVFKPVDILFLSVDIFTTENWFEDTFFRPIFLPEKFFHIFHIIHIFLKFCDCSLFRKFDYFFFENLVIYFGYCEVLLHRFCVTVHIWAKASEGILRLMQL